MRRILLLLLLLHPGEVVGAPAKPASTEDVNVLMYGVLQFSEVLHHTYQNTEGKLARAAASLRQKGGALARLQEEAQHAARTEELIRQNLAQLKTQTAGLHSQAVQLKGELRQIEQEETALQNQVAHLETMLRNSSPSQITTLKELSLQHSNVLKVLKKWTQDQKHSLENQNQQLNQLQRMARYPQQWSLKPPNHGPQQPSI